MALALQESQGYNEQEIIVERPDGRKAARDQAMRGRGDLARKRGRGHFMPRQASI